MKRYLALALALLLALSVFFVSCNQNTEPTGQSDAPTDAPTDKPTEQPTEEPTEKPTEKPTERPTERPTDKPEEPDTTLYTHVHSYIEEDVFGEMTALFEKDGASAIEYWLGGAPYIMADVFGLSDSTLKSISIPVMKTASADADGNFIFTISVFHNDLGSIASSAPLRTYPIKISAEAYGLSANTSNIHKMITVDLDEYGIALAADETIAVSSPGDTLVPAYLANRAAGLNPLLDLLKTEAEQMLSFSMYAGSQAFDLASNTLFYNFTCERSYVGKEAYEAAIGADAELEEMIAALKNHYYGLDLSVFGDSISTYYGISNNTKYNPTIADNALWYNTGAIDEALLYDHTYTYWGRMLREFDMELCVNNSWSGDSLGSGRFMNRAKQLHDPSGHTPDVIVIYFGINDTWGQGREVGELLGLIADRGDKTQNEVVAEWYDSVVAKDGNCSYWDELYATLLHTIATEYPDAKMICVSLAHNGAKADYPSADKWVPQYNAAMKAMADYLDITFVDQTNVITGENCHAYMHDTRYLHPNSHGHKLIFEEIVRTLYRELF